MEDVGRPVTMARCICKQTFYAEVRDDKLYHQIVDGVFACGRDRYGTKNLGLHQWGVPVAPTTDCNVCIEQAGVVAPLRGLANLPHEQVGKHRTFANFIPREGAMKALEAAREFTNHFVPQTLVLSGISGGGKSHLLEAIGRVYVDREQLVKYDTAAAMADRFRATNAQDSELSSQDVFNWYRGFPVLLLDELKEGTTEYAADKVLELVDDRLQNGGRLVIATNLTSEQVKDDFGPRLRSRLFDTSDTNVTYHVNMRCEDYRLGD